MTTPHPFARFIAILGRGKNLSRPLTIEEAEEAMTMILDGAVEPEQLGAFLMLLRIKEESPEELAGFTRAVRKKLPAPPSGLLALDWPSYAGKKRQLPWFLLSALALAQSGTAVLVHGFDNHTPGRLYTGEVLAQLGLKPAESFGEAENQLKAQNFAYLDLAAISAPLAHMMGLKPLLGLRSPIHSLARQINPLGAGAQILGIFHPNYMSIHRDAALALGDRNMIVFRGEGGEAERRPGKPCEILGARDGEAFETRWPPSFDDPRQIPDEQMDPSRLQKIWSGERTDPYAEAAITGALALALLALNRAQDPDDAQKNAERIWDARQKSRLLAA